MNFPVSENTDDELWQGEMYVCHYIYTQCMSVSVAVCVLSCAYATAYIMKLVGKELRLWDTIEGMLLRVFLTFRRRCAVASTALGLVWPIDTASHTRNTVTVAHTHAGT